MTYQINSEPLAATIFYNDRSYTFTCYSPENIDYVLCVVVHRNPQCIFKETDAFYEHYIYQVLNHLRAPRTYFIRLNNIIIDIKNNFEKQFTLLAIKKIGL